MRIAAIRAVMSRVSRLHYRLALLTGLAVITVAVGSFLVLTRRYERDLLQHIEARAQVLAAQIDVTRDYITKHYVDKVQRGRGKSFLAVPDYAASDRIPLPFTATREMADQMAARGLYNAKLVSLTPLNPINLPSDAFEREALQAIEAGAESFVRIEPVEGIPQFRRMTPDKALTAGCTSCHSTKRVGDVLGGLSVSIPLTATVAATQQYNRQLGGTTAALTLGLLSILYFIYYRSISRRQQAVETLRQAQERFRGIYESSKDAMGYATLDGRLLDVNEAFVTLTGYTRQELLTRQYQDLTPVEYHQFEMDIIQNILMTGEPTEYEKEYIRKDGSRVPIALTTFVVKGRDEKPAGLAAIIKDITLRKRLEEQLWHQALHDPLTNLPNRALFSNHLQQALKRALRDRNYLFAVLFVDLDRFKVINDSLGHVQGDSLLQVFARRLEDCLRPGDTVARFGGDEFAILLDPIKDISDATRVADRIHQTMTPPFALEGHEVFTSASIGIAISASGYDQPEHLLRDADTAMYRAKMGGRARTEVFDTAMHAQVVTRLRLEADLRRALERQEFRIYYQPIVSFASGKMIGFEALIRWQHPERGLVPPVEFIPVAEETGLILPIGRWLLRTACQQISTWQKQYPATSPLTVSVNLSSKEFLQADLVEKIEEVLQEVGFEPTSLRLEITESVMMENADFIVAMLEQLRARGIQLYVDDFGTGYSSLSYLHRFRIDALKIDQSFTSRMLTSSKDREIIRTIMALAQSLGIDSIAEGVESSEQLAQLKGLQCNSGQGYYFSQPVDKQIAESLVAEMRGKKG